MPPPRLLAIASCATRRGPVPFFDARPLPSLLPGITDLGYLRRARCRVPSFHTRWPETMCWPRAETGTGKTAAFVLPILQRLFNGAEPAPGRDARADPRAHTRAGRRRSKTIQGLTYHTTITSAAVYGGVPMDPQDRALRAGVYIVVATPGRLMDHMRAATPDFARLEVLVLDEADRMMDMGFWPDVQRIVGTLPERQTLLFSATLPDEIMKLAKAIVRDAKHIQVGRARRTRVVDQAHRARRWRRARRCRGWLRFLRERAGSDARVLRRKSGADWLARDLARLGIRATALHGDRSQGSAPPPSKDSAAGRHHVLVATDLAARGLDIDGITYVVNFEVPDTPESYVHRVGRTGRDRADGTAVTLVSPEEERAFRALEKSVGVQLQ